MVKEINFMDVYLATKAFEKLFQSSLATMTIKRKGEKKEILNVHMY